ncbi:HET-domain-containing protein, partial [Glonium stellatum]
YAALSYCWGKSKKTTTTTIHNLHEHIEAGFSYELLGKTIQDAVSITRSIGVRYLWVDALCIIQGSEDEARADWQTESSRMAAVYGNAYVTIIAADSPTSDSGILRKRSIIRESSISQDGFTQRRIYSAFRNTKILEAASSTPNIWSTRAWTFQEAVLSRRALLYTDQKKYWKCGHGLLSEDGKLARSTLIHRLTRNLVEQDWHLVIEEYTKRRLSNGNDKLPALSGLASLYHRGNATPYLAGLWNTTLLSDLLWRTEISAELMPQHTQSYRAPSWSWASVDGPV